MKKNLLPLLAGCILFASCTKEEFTPLAAPGVPCKLQTDNPLGRSYVGHAVLDYVCADKHCGLLPLSTANYWVYLDSVFTDGVLSNVKLDTLRYSTTFKTLPDGLVWWKGSMNVGLPDRLYANDSTLFKLENRLFITGIIDVKRDYSLFTGDSLRYLASFEDNAALGRSLKLKTAVNVPAGIFNDCIYFEKDARNFRKDQVYFKPGIGVLKYILEKAPVGQPVMKLQKISTLVDFHIE